MPTVKGCSLPDDLLYDVENQVWFRELGDGTVCLGMTAVATAMSGKLVAFTPRRAGREIKAGRSCATVESGKWVGPVKTAASGEVVAVNDAVVANPSLANEDPYGNGWLIVLRPLDWDTVKASLVPGAQVAGPYEAKMNADGFDGCAPAHGPRHP
jgi:glycine cleavage system H protein